MFKPNLLPYKYRPQPLYEPRRLLNLLTISVVVFSIIFGISLLNLSISHEKQKISDITESIDQLEAVVNRIEELEKITINNTELQGISQNLREGKVEWSTVLKDISRVLGDKVRFISLSRIGEEQENRVNDINNQQQKNTKPTLPYLVIEGTAKTMEEVGQYALGLRTLPWCDDVKIRIVSEEEVEGKLIFEMTPLISMGGVKK